MARKKVTPAEQRSDEPYAEITRYGWFSWVIFLGKGDAHYGTTWYVHGSEKRANAFAARKLRARKRRDDWKKNVKRLDIER
jgi:hypothetical protein